MDMGQLRICDAHLKTLDDGPSYNRKPETQCMPLAAALGLCQKIGCLKTYVQMRTGSQAFSKVT